jgi:DNA polymerase/3'-5' exonuclease PolX
MRRDEGMTPEYARGMAGALVDLLSPACVRIEIAGSVRRQKANPNDIEIVAVPRINEMKQAPAATIDLFGNRQVVPVTVETRNDLDVMCDLLLAQGTLEKWPDSRGQHCWGTGIKRTVFFRGQDYAPVDLFQVIEPRQWGVIYAIRTGPGDFNKLLVTNQWFGGACPRDRKVAGGRVWFIVPDRRDLARMAASNFARLAERGEIDASVIPTPTEEDFFRQMGVPCWSPEQRTEHKLMQFVRQAR